MTMYTWGRPLVLKNLSREGPCEITRVSSLLISRVGCLSFVLSASSFVHPGLTFNKRTPYSNNVSKFDLMIDSSICLQHSSMPFSSIWLIVRRSMSSMWCSWRASSSELIVAIPYWSRKSSGIRSIARWLPSSICWDDRVRSDACSMSIPKHDRFTTRFGALPTSDSLSVRWIHVYQNELRHSLHSILVCMFDRRSKLVLWVSLDDDRVSREWESVMLEHSSHSERSSTARKTHLIQHWLWTHRESCIEMPPARSMAAVRSHSSRVGLSCSSSWWLECTPLDLYGSSWTQKMDRCSPSLSRKMNREPCLS